MMLQVGHSMTLKKFMQHQKFRNTESLSGNRCVLHNIVRIGQLSHLKELITVAQKSFERQLWSAYASSLFLA